VVDWSCYSQIFDKDGNGQITAEELAAIMKSLNLEIDRDTIALMIKAVDVVCAVSLTINFSLDMVLAPIRFRQLFVTPLIHDSLSQDGDETISLNEFRKMMMDGPS